MIRTRLSAVFLLLLFLALCANLTSAQQPIPGITKDGIPLQEIRLHDPWILADQASRTYYLYTSGRPVAGTRNANVICYTSKDLNTWSGPYLVFEVRDRSWADPRAGVWAPEVHPYKGKFYLFATLHNYGQPIPPQAGDQDSKGGTRIQVTYNGAGQHLRGTQTFVSDSPLGPFRVIGEDKPVPPLDYMTLDGTLFLEDGIPYMVYAHEWLQVVDGTMEAIQMTPDLSASVGRPFYLFKGSDASWLQERQETTNKPAPYVTDGPEFCRTSKGKLLMIWSSYRDGKYVETLAHSVSGRLKGPWRQGDVLLGDDSGHGMLFNTFDGRLMLMAHHPMDGRLSRAKLVEIEDTGDSIRVKER